MNDDININSLLTDISPFDDSFPVKLLSEIFNYQIEQANHVAIKIYNNVVEKSNQFVLPFENNEQTKLVLDVSDKFVDDVHNGKLKLVEENGEMFAQLRENGRYSKKIPIKEEIFNDELSAKQAQLALQFKDVQELLITINNQLKIIDLNVHEVIKGQQNNRIGLYYSGIALYIESENCENDDLKYGLKIQSIKELTEAIYQIILTMKTDINYLKNKEYDSHKKQRVRLITEKINSINQCFKIIHQASIMKTGIYYRLGEIKSACAVLEEYSRFINGTVISNASLLSECDITDTGTSLGTWKKRANLHLDITNLSLKLKENYKEIYLDIKKMEEI